MHFNCCSSRMVFVWTVIVALGLGGSCLLAFWGMSKIITLQLQKQTELKKGTEQWDRFEELPFPIQYNVRFFEVNNTDDILHHNKTPILIESPPYKYNMFIKRTDIIFDDDEDDGVTYRQEFKFEFDDSGDVNENHNVTIINPIYFAAFQLCNSLEKVILSGCLHEIMGQYGIGDVFLTKPVKQLLFGGVRFAYPNVTAACKIVRTFVIEKIKNIRVIEYDEEDDHLIFAMFRFKQQNYLKESTDGIYTINRGIKDMTKLGSIIKWNGKDQLELWGNSKSTNNDTCKRVGGSDSTLYRPQLVKGEPLKIFNTDICRMVEIAYKGSTDSYQGIKGFKYETGPNTFRSSTPDPENDCYCLKATKDLKGQDNCWLDGLFDFKPCLGAPVLISHPHFLYAEKYKDAIIGMDPRESLHKMSVLLEPNTGIPLKGMKRIQLNSVVKREGFGITPDTLYEAIFPILWLEEGVELPQKYVNMINNQYFKVVKIAEGAKYALIAFFAALLAVCIFFIIRKECFEKHNKYI